MFLSVDPGGLQKHDPVKGKSFWASGNTPIKLCSGKRYCLELKTYCVRDLFHMRLCAVVCTVSTPSFLDNKQDSNFENVIFFSMSLHILYDFLFFISKRKFKLDQEMIFIEFSIS